MSSICKVPETFFKRFVLFHIVLLCAVLLRCHLYYLALVGLCFALLFPPGSCLHLGIAADALCVCVSVGVGWSRWAVLCWTGFTVTHCLTDLIWQTASPQSSSMLPLAQLQTHMSPCILTTVQPAVFAAPPEPPIRG